MGASKVTIAVVSVNSVAMFVTSGSVGSVGSVVTSGIFIYLILTAEAIAKVTAVQRDLYIVRIFYL